MDFCLGQVLYPVSTSPLNLLYHFGKEKGGDGAWPIHFTFC